MSDKDRLLDRLIKDFSKDKLVQFYKLSSGKFRPVSEDFSDNLPEDDKRFESIEQIGRIEHEKKAKSIAFFISSVSGEISERDSKKKQYDIGKKILKDNYLDAGIFVFYGENNFRLSLIAASYSGPKRKFTTFKRYTYFVSPELTNKTFKDQLKKCDFSSIESILEVFSIEAVNKDFYTQIALKFTELTGGWRKVGSKKVEKEACMELPDTVDEKVYKEFAVRLIGRLIFCWFLKKKTSKNNIPLIPEGILSSTAIEKNEIVGKYYHGVLEPLFFELLNTPQDKRKKEYNKEPWLLIPFLNGGLFTPHEHDFYELANTGYSKHINTLIIPDDWIKELLEIFERYNFTIDENTPIDVELSIEPEMLGRIFENLLAEINPETGETARKSTGSYYTPRAIVEYMVDESLRQYLLTKTGINEKKISGLLSYAEDDGSKLKEDEAEAIIKALHDVRIIDPACGSGAFLIGILQKNLLILQKLDPDSKKWLKKMLANIPDPLLRGELTKKIKVPNYLHKLGIIRDCIFGVDIQPIAVEISKLRCFLSLIVDEDVDDKEENRGIEHLPNLEFKYVCANTLIGLPKAEKEKGRVTRSKIGNVRTQESLGQKMMFEADDKINELKELRELYLTAMPDEKKKIENRFRKVQSAMFEHNRKMGGQVTQTSKLSQWNPFSDEASSWFDPYWMFNIKDGFDIVIANPPYLKERDNKERFAEVNKSDFGKKYHQGKMDFWYYFLHKAIDIIKHGGSISYITSRYWLNSTGAKKLIARVKENLSFTNFVDIGKLKVFDNVAGHHMVAVYAKDKAIEDFTYKKLINDLSDIDKNQDTDNMTIRIKRNSTLYSDSHEIIIEDDLIEFDKTIKLGVISDVFQGVVQNPDKVSITSANKYNLPQGEGVFILNQEEYKVLQLNAKERKFVRPFYDECDVHKYLVRAQEKKYIIYLTRANCKDINMLPNLKKHLLKYKKIMDTRRETKKGVNKWFHLHWPREEEYFKRKKLILPAMFKRQNVGYQEEEGYFGLSSNVVIQKDENYDLRYIIAILNSNLTLDWFYRYGKKRGVGVDIGVNKLRTFPIKELSPASQKPFISLVDKILNITKNDDYLGSPAKQAKVKELENQIDLMVYKLYGLTEAEIPLVEGR